LRLHLAAAVVRAGMEAESDLASQRYQLFGGDPMPLVATSAEHADYAKRLGEEADRVAHNEPLLAPQRAAESLEAVPRPDAVDPLSVQRLLKLASAASRTAALSSRVEIYPRGMPASQAIRQSLGALVGPKYFTVEQLTDRIRGRYPDAETLPPRPALDALLDAAGSNLAWNESGPNGPRYYVQSKGFGAPAGSTTSYARHDTFGEESVPISGEIAEARQFEERLEHGMRAGGFLALTVSPRMAHHAEMELLRRFDLERLSFDGLLLAAMREQARALKVEWQTVLAADISAPGSRDWTNLMRLVQKGLPQVLDQIAKQDKNILLVHPGLLARYQIMQKVEELRDKAGRPGSLFSLWMLVPMSANGLPDIDGTPVPVITSAQWSHIPQAWINNTHRAGTSLMASGK
jgi:hypothetical protein